MKKQGILNIELSRVVSGLGHGDQIVIADIGLPVPPGVPVIDLAVTYGIPRFAQVLDTVMQEMEVERALIAREAGPEVRGWLGNLSPEETDHENFKSACAKARAVIRTGEATPYANILLSSGVIF